MSKPLACLCAVLLSSWLSACSADQAPAVETAEPAAAPADTANDDTGTLPAVAATTEPDSPYDEASMPPAAREPDVIYVPTPQPVVDAMLELAQVQEGDVLYDLGSGDGRIPITAAQKYGVRAVGIDINPVRIREAKDNAEKAGVTDLVSFHEADLFLTDVSEADVVTLYLLQSLNVKLRPKLLAELEPGTRIVSHAFDMADEWEPERTEQVGTSTIYLWTVPER